nr:protein disulfide-isomerase-like [Tanacetum cinerariifolium]
MWKDIWVKRLKFKYATRISFASDVDKFDGSRCEPTKLFVFVRKVVDLVDVRIITNCSMNRIHQDSLKVLVGGVLQFKGEEFENFSAIANQVLWDSWDYDFFHTTDASLLPRGESPITVPTLRLLKPYDELFVDFQ